MSRSQKYFLNPGLAFEVLVFEQSIYIICNVILYFALHPEQIEIMNF